MTTAKQHIENLVRCRGDEFKFVKIGMMVKAGGDIGTIKGVNCSANLDVVFANQLKHGKRKHNCHPSHDITYYNEDGNPIAIYGG